MEREQFYNWYKNLPEEDRKIVNGLIVISITTAVENGTNTVDEVRKHVWDCFIALKEKS